MFQNLNKSNLWLDYTVIYFSIWKCCFAINIFSSKTNELMHAYKTTETKWLKNSKFRSKHFISLLKIASLQLLH